MLKTGIFQTQTAFIGDLGQSADMLLNLTIDRSLVNCLYNEIDEKADLLGIANQALFVNLKHEGIDRSLELGHIDPSARRFIAQRIGHMGERYI